MSLVTGTETTTTPLSYIRAQQVGRKWLADTPWAVRAQVLVVMLDGTKFPAWVDREGNITRR